MTDDPCFAGFKADLLRAAADGLHPAYAGDWDSFFADLIMGNLPHPREHRAAVVAALFADPEVAAARDRVRVLSNRPDFLAY